MPQQLKQPVEDTLGLVLGYHERAAATLRKWEAEPSENIRKRHEGVIEKLLDKGETLMPELIRRLKGCKRDSMTECYAKGVDACTGLAYDIRTAVNKGYHR